MTLTKRKAPRRAAKGRSPRMTPRPYKDGPEPCKDLLPSYRLGAVLRAVNRCPVRDAADVARQSLALVAGEDSKDRARYTARIITALVQRTPGSGGCLL